MNKLNHHKNMCSFNNKIIIIFNLLLLLCRMSSNALIARPRPYNKPKTIIPEHYVKEIRPPTPKGRPLNVEFSMNVVDINSINVEDMDFRMDMFLRQQWTDTRLRIPDELFEYGDDSVTIPTHFFESLWQPDLYFLNSKIVEIATLTQKFSSVTLFRNKTVRYSARMHAIVACQMEFQHYPMDIQTCPLNIESFQYDNTKMRLKWSESGVQVSPELKLLQYHIGQPLQLGEKNVFTVEKNGNFSRLIVYFRFERQIGHHLIQTFAPSTLVVMVSWFSFWLGLDAIPGRVALLVTCVLTLVTMFTGLRSDIPPVAYVKAIDLWMAGCMIFVFSALCEFVVVKVFNEKYKERKRKIEMLAGNNELALTPFGTRGTRQRHSISHHLKMAGLNSRRKSIQKLFKYYWINEYGQEKILWCEIDRLSAIIFPTLFLIFMIIYWPVLIIGKSFAIHK